MSYETLVIWRCELCGEKVEGHIVRHTVACFVLCTIEMVRLRTAQKERRVK